MFDALLRFESFGQLLAGVHTFSLALLIAGADTSLLQIQRGAYSNDDIDGYPDICFWNPITTLSERGRIGADFVAVSWQRVFNRLTTSF